MTPIPIKLMLFGTIKYIVKITIKCPNTENCLGTGNIVRMGRDHSHSKKSYRYRCEECASRSREGAEKGVTEPMRGSYFMNKKSCPYNG